MNLPRDVMSSSAIWRIFANTQTVLTMTPLWKCTQEVYYPRFTSTILKEMYLKGTPTLSQIFGNRIMCNSVSRSSFCYRNQKYEFISGARMKYTRFRKYDARKKSEFKIIYLFPRTQQFV